METVMITTSSPVTTIRRGNPFKASRLEKSPFNMVSPPNKTIIDAMHGTFSDMNQVTFGVVASQKSHRAIFKANMSPPQLSVIFKIMQNHFCGSKICESKF